ncbi:MAG TPA: ATP-binding protein [bacterium]|nr:ATP-binding protein [bacterium]
MNIIGFLKKFKPEHLKNKRKSILFKTLILLWSVIIFTILIFTLALIPYQKNILTGMLESEAKTIASSISQITATALISEDFSFVVDHCMGVVNERPSIIYVVITRKDGFSLIHNKKNWTDKTLNGFWVSDELKKGRIIYSDIAGKEVFHYTASFKYSGIDWGWIHIGLSLKKFNADFNAIHIRLLLISFFCIFCGLIISYIFSKKISAPIFKLLDITRKVTGGDLSVKTVIRTGDEIETLFESFNTMTETIKNSQEKIIIVNKYLFNILKCMNDTLFVMTAGGIIKTVNSALTNLLGYEENELAGQSVIHIIEPELFSKILDFGNYNIKGYMSNIEIKYISKNKKEIPVLFSAALMRDENNNIQGVVCAAVNISQTKKMMEELKNKSEQIEESAKKVAEAYNLLQETQEQLIQSEKMAAIGTLAAGIGHEINNPMAFIKWNINSLKKFQNKLAVFFYETETNNNANIVSFAEFIKKTNFKKIIKDMEVVLNETSEGIERVIYISQNLKMLTHPGSDTFEKCDINSIIRKVFNFLIREYKYKIRFELDLGEIRKINGNSQQLMQVFMNLLINAADSIINENGQIIIKTYCEKDNLFIIVSDNGRGIPDEIKHKVFDPFFTTKETGKGTGLGLNIVYKIIKKHKGNISFDSVLNGGSTFIIELPVSE